MEFQFNIMLTVALAVLLGTFGARVFKRLKVPQVVAYILIGVLLGATGLNVIDANTVEGLAPLSLLALGIIGFMIGGEVKRRQGFGRTAFARDRVPQTPGFRPDF